MFGFFQRLIFDSGSQTQSPPQPEPGPEQERKKGRRQFNDIPDHIVAQRVREDDELMALVVSFLEVIDG